MEGFLSGLLGMCFGSFLWVIIERGTRRESWIQGRSYCPHCHTVLNGWELIPLVSYLYLCGRCRYCRQAIPASHFLAEVSGGVLGYLCWCTGRIDWSTLLFCVLIFLISGEDYRVHEISLNVLYTLGGWQLVLLLLRQTSLVTIILSMGTAGILYGAVFIGSYLWYEKEVFGMGDLYYLVTLSLWFSAKDIVCVGATAFVIGGFVASGLLLTKRVTSKTEIAFAPMMSLAALCIYFYG